MLEYYKSACKIIEENKTLVFIIAEELLRKDYLTFEDVVDQIIDWFGKNVEFRHENDRLVATVKSSPRAMLYWAVQYADCVEIISPLRLRGEVVNYLKMGLKNYKEN